MDLQVAGFQLRRCEIGVEFAIRGTPNTLQAEGIRRNDHANRLPH